MQTVAENEVYEDRVTGHSSRQSPTEARLVAYPNISWSSDSTSIHLYIYYELQGEHLDDPWVRPERILNFYLSCRLDDLELGPLPHDSSGRTLASDVEVRTFLRFALYDLELFLQCFPTRPGTLTQNASQDQHNTIPDSLSPNYRKARYIFARAATKFYRPNRLQSPKRATTRMSTATQHPPSSLLRKPRASDKDFKNTIDPTQLTYYETFLAAFKAQICTLARRKLLIQPSTSYDNPTTAFVAFYSDYEQVEIANRRLPFRAGGEVVAVSEGLVLVLLVATNAVNELEKLFPSDWDAPWWLFSRRDRYCSLDVCWLEPEIAGALLAQSTDGRVFGSGLGGDERELLDLEKGQGKKTFTSLDLAVPFRAVTTAQDSLEQLFTTVSRDGSSAATETTLAAPPSPGILLDGTDDDITVVRHDSGAHPPANANASGSAASTEATRKPLVVIKLYLSRHYHSTSESLIALKTGNALEDGLVASLQSVQLQKSDLPAKGPADSPPEIHSPALATYDSQPTIPIEPSILAPSSHVTPTPSSSSVATASTADQAHIISAPHPEPSSSDSTTTTSDFTYPSQSTTHRTLARRHLRITASLATRVDRCFIRYQLVARTWKSLH